MLCQFIKYESIHLFQTSQTSYLILTFELAKNCIRSKKIYEQTVAVCRFGRCTHVIGTTLRLKPSVLYIEVIRAFA